MTPQYSGWVGCIARMSWPIMPTTITGTMPAITMFIDNHSGSSDMRSAAR